MKKLRLKALNLGAREILDREQLRSITGGSGTPCTSSTQCGALQSHCVNGYCQSSTAGQGSQASGSGGGGVIYATPGGTGRCPSTGTVECYCGYVFMGCIDTFYCSRTVCQN